MYICTHNFPNLFLYLWFLFSLNEYICGVDRNNFKTCQQSSFCSRNRNLNGQPLYDAIPESLQISTSLSLDVVNKKNSVIFQLDVYALEDSTFRVKFNEKLPLYKRFEDSYSLLENIQYKKLDVKNKTNSGLTAFCNDYMAVITYAPLKIDFYKSGIHAFSFNSNGLLNFEHYRKRQNAKEPNEHEEAVDEGNLENEETENHSNLVDEHDPEGIWSETFKGHVDSKPHGSSSIGVDFTFVQGQDVYGIPQHADSLKLKDTSSGDPYRLYNLDVFEYELNNPMALYGSIPFMIGHSAKVTCGVFWHNPSETWIDVKYLPSTNVVASLTGLFSSSEKEQPHALTHWFSESGVIDFFVMLGDKPIDVFRQYSLLTGATPLPPMFSLGYHQSRWNYNDEEDVEQVHENFDKYGVAVDVIWLDIEHTDSKKYFTWDSHKFPNPETMINKLSAKGRKTVLIVDPHIKKDASYSFYQQNKDQDHYIKNKDGNDFDGWCWPGSSAYLDFTNENARKLYLENFSFEKFKGTTPDVFIWNDMNEPSVFNGPEVTMPKDAIHSSIGVEHREIHNVFGLLFHSSTYKGLLERSEGELRPFVLTRAHFAGSQRTAAVWTGDNTADWGHLKISVPMVLSESIAGITHIGADVGGFFGNPDGELLSRWYQAAAYTTFYRAHAHIDTKRREPWLYGEPTLSIAREAIKDHYRILPYIYTLFYENEMTGAPPLRPLWVEFPSDEQTFNIDDEYLVGPAILVRPVVESGATSAQVYFPRGIWYDIKDQSKFIGPSTVTVNAPLEKIPVYQKGGSIVVTKERPRRSATLMRNDPITLNVALDEHHSAEGSLYLDDEHTFEYRKGHFLYLRLQYKNGELTCKKIDPNGSFDANVWLERVVILGIHQKPNKVKLHSDTLGLIPLEFTYEEHTPQKSSKLTVIKPGIKMTLQFSISFE